LLWQDVGPTSVNIYNHMTRHHLSNPGSFLTIVTRQENE
jgi:hypothetical protein